MINVPNGPYSKGPLVVPVQPSNAAYSAVQTGGRWPQKSLVGGTLFKQSITSRNLVMHSGVVGF